MDDWFAWSFSPWVLIFHTLDNRWMMTTTMMIELCSDHECSRYEFFTRKHSLIHISPNSLLLVWWIHRTAYGCIHTFINGKFMWHFCHTICGFTFDALISMDSIAIDSCKSSANWGKFLRWQTFVENLSTIRTQNYRIEQVLKSDVHDMVEVLRLILD